MTGHFTEHHAFLLGKMIARIEAIEADIREVDARIEAQLAPFAPAAAQLLDIPGIGPAAAAAIIAEIGVDMTRFPTPAHLAGWAKFAPGVKESAGRRKRQRLDLARQPLPRPRAQAYRGFRGPDRHVPR